MKQINAIIRSDRLDEVKQCLIGVGVEGMTVAEVRGFGSPCGNRVVYRGTEYAVDFVPKIVITIIASEDQVESILEAVIRGARTGKMGDGKIFVTPVEEVIRIRNGQRSEAAI